MAKHLYSAKSIILFRFYKDFEIARERIKILRHFNPSIPVHGLFGGQPEDHERALNVLGDLTENIWNFGSNETPKWKWFHTDLIQKAWFRDIGHKIDFDFMFSYEYDILTAASLLDIYPDTDDNTLTLAAVDLLKNVEKRWDWTSKEPSKSRFVQFSNYMNQKYSIKQQKYVCLGPGPLLPRKFIEKFSDTEDIDLVHEEIAYPAYAEALGFKLADHGMHPGFYRGSINDLHFFNCNGDHPSLPEIFQQLRLPNGRRSFHPVKLQVTLEDIILNLAPDN